MSSYDTGLGHAFLGIAEGIEQRRRENIEQEQYKEKIKLEQDKIKILEREQELKERANEVEMQKIAEAARMQKVKSTTEFMNNYVPMNPNLAAELDPYMPGFFLPDEVAAELGRPTGAGKEYYVPKDVVKEYTEGGRLQKAKTRAETTELGVRAEKGLSEIQAKVEERMQEARKTENKQIRMMMYQSKLGKFSPSDKALYISLGIMTEKPDEFAKELEMIGLGTSADATAKIAYTQFVAGALKVSTADAIMLLEKNDKASFVKTLVGGLMQNDIRLSNPSLDPKEKEKILRGLGESASILYDNYTTSGQALSKISGAEEKAKNKKKEIENHIQEWKNKGKKK